MRLSTDLPGINIGPLCLCLNTLCLCITHIIYFLFSDTLTSGALLTLEGLPLIILAPSPPPTPPQDYPIPTASK